MLAELEALSSDNGAAAAFEAEVSRHAQLLEQLQEELRNSKQRQACGEHLCAPRVFSTSQFNDTDVNHETLCVADMLPGILV